jgi:hypothetical protein
LAFSATVSGLGSRFPLPPKSGIVRFLIAADCSSSTSHGMSSAEASGRSASLYG